MEHKTLSSPIFKWAAIARMCHYTYLGVTLLSDLSWSKHIHELCTKSKKIVGPFYRTFHLHHHSPYKLLQLYIYLTRPCLEYACAVWNPLHRDVEKIEKVQKFTLKLCLKQMGHGICFSTSCLKPSCPLSPLEI